MMDYGKMIFVMVLANKYILMEMNTMEAGSIIW